MHCMDTHINVCELHCWDNTFQYIPREEKTTTSLCHETWRYCPQSSQGHKQFLIESVALCRISTCLHFHSWQPDIARGIARGLTSNSWPSQLPEQNFPFVSIYMYFCRTFPRPQVSGKGPFRGGLFFLQYHYLRSSLLIRKNFCQLLKVYLLCAHNKQSV